MMAADLPDRTPGPPAVEAPADRASCHHGQASPARAWRQLWARSRGQARQHLRCNQFSPDALSSPPPQPPGPVASRQRPARTIRPATSAAAVRWTAKPFLDAWREAGVFDGESAVRSAPPTRHSAASEARARRPPPTAAAGAAAGQPTTRRRKSSIRHSDASAA